MKTLKDAYKIFNNVCTKLGVQYDIVCDEDSIQGYLVPKRQGHLCPDILSRLSESLDFTHVKMRQVRGGTVFAVSMLPISEQTIGYLVDTGTEREERYHKRLELALGLSECDARCSKMKSLGRKKYKTMKEEVGLQGMASTFQPTEVLERVNAAMRELELQDRLRQARVFNRLSDDRQLVSFFVRDEDGQERMIASFDVQELAKPPKLQEMLDNLSDIADKRAPGDGKRERETIRDVEQNLRKVAQKYGMDDPQ